MKTKSEPNAELMAHNLTRQRTVSGGFSVAGALKKYNEYISNNKAIPWGTKGANSEEKSRLALEAGRFYKDELQPHKKAWENMRGWDLGHAVGLEAADFTDPNGNLGTLTGTLVMQDALPLFAYDYPELLAMFTDFSAEAGCLEQASDTRIISIPATEKYNSAKDGAGRPQGWSTVSPAISQDVQVTLTDYIGVPIVFGADTLSETQRDLFGEFAAAAIKSIAGYFTGMMTKLLTVANFNAYAQITAPDANGFVYVPTAYSSYAKNLQDFSMTDLDKLSAIFTTNKVPRGDRGILLSPMYYARLRSDPRLEFFFAASQGNPVLTQQKLPDGLSGFFPYEAPYLPNTGNLAFFPFHKAGIVLKSRLPQDFKKALLSVMIPGSVTPVTDPDTKLSVALVEYVNLTQNFAESRPEVILGASVGDNRGGLCGTSQ